MKKSLLLVSVAAVALTACTSESVEYVGDSQQAPREIAFAPLAQPSTRAAVSTTTFPTDKTMQVAAYDVTHTRDFFGATTFSYSSSSNIWKGGKYWPLSAAYINFLAYANFEGSSATWGSTHKASGVTLVMTDNKTVQQDLMYAIGHGEVTQSGNALTFPENVPMVFNHAQAWITFNVKAANTASQDVTINKITLNGAKYNGTYTITHTGYNATSSQSVAGAWSSLGSTADVVVPGWSATTLTTGGADVGNGLMIVPDDNAATGDFTSFTINYTLDGQTYDYTFTPVNTNVDQAKHYIYNITFTLHEIEIAATVANWQNQTINYVDIPSTAFAYVASTGETGTYTLPSATAGTYSCTITGLPADTYTVEEYTTDGTDFITSVLPSSAVTLGADDPLNISFTVTASSGNSRKIVIKNDEATPVTLFTLTVTQP